MLVVTAPSLGSSDAQVKVRTAHVYPLGPEVPLQAVAGQASQSHQYLQIPPREAPTLLSFQVNSPAVVAQYVSLGSSTGWGGTQLRRGAGHGGSIGIASSPDRTCWGLIPSTAPLGSFPTEAGSGEKRPGFKQRCADP